MKGKSHSEIIQYIIDGQNRDIIRGWAYFRKKGEHMFSRF